MSSAVVVQSQPRARATRIAGVACALLIAAATLVAVNAIFPKNFSMYRAPWVLHPFEQEHLMMARNIAVNHRLTIADASLDPAYGSEDKGYVHGRFVPRSVLLPYFIYAPSFLISDTAWLYVTPIFALLATAGVGALVWQASTNRPATVAAMLAFRLSAPAWLAGSGVAYESMIALAFLLWGSFALQLYVRKASATWGIGAGLLFAAATASRADYAPAAALFVAIVLLRAGWIFARHRRVFLASAPGAGLAGCLIAAAGIGSIFATNYAFTGSPFHSAYPANSWLGSTSGVAHSLTIFHPAEFLRQARFFLWDIGAPTLPLLVAGLVLGRAQLRSNVALLLLLLFAAFLAAFHLARTGSHASDGPNLVSSVPRYLLPVYAVAAVSGFSAIAAGMPRITMAQALPAGAAVLALGVVAATVGLNEAYTGRTSIPTTEAIQETYRAAADLSELHKDALFVADINSSAVIVTPRTLIPRLTGPQDRVPELVHRELSDGREVFITDDLRHTVGNPLYSGYLGPLLTSGLAICPVQDAPMFAEVIDPAAHGRPKAGDVRVPANAENGIAGPVLEAGRDYYLVSSGSFVNSVTGGKSPAAYFLVNGGKVKSFGAEGTPYCARIRGTGEAIRLSVADTVFSDNSGSLLVSIYAVGQTANRGAVLP